MSESIPDQVEDEDDSPVLRIGCAGLPNGVSRPHYFENLDLLEADVTFFEPPRDLALRRWKQEAPPGAGFTMLAWQLVTHDPSTAGYERLTQPLTPEVKAQVGSLKITPAVKDAWQRTVAASQVLGAEVIVLQTPPSFAPSAANQDAMRRFFGEIVGKLPEGTVVAWEPRGVWAPAQAAKLARELEILYALDPLALEVEPPEGPYAYFRLYGLGLQRGKIDENNMDLLADMLDLYSVAWVVFNNVEKYRDAQRFRKLMAGRAFVAE
jgi:uncharacterized protein YecE (DUF72 family)